MRGFHARDKQKRSCACDCGRGLVSVGAFFLLLSFFSQPESCLKIKIFVGKKGDVLGRAWGGDFFLKKKNKIKNKKWKNEKFRKK